MDYYSNSTPVSKRTRLRTAEFFKQIHAQIQKSKRSSSVNNDKDNGTDGGGGGGCVGRSTAASTSTDGKGGEEDDVQLINEPRLGKPIVLDDTDEEEEDEEIESDQSSDEDEIEELTNQVSNINKIGVGIASQLSSDPKGRITSKKVHIGYVEDSDDGVAGQKNWNTNDIIQVERKQDFIDLDEEEEIRAEKRYKRKRGKSLDKYEAEEGTEELTDQFLDEIGVLNSPQLFAVTKGGIASKKLGKKGDMGRKSIQASNTNVLLDLFSNTIWGKGEEGEAAKKQTDPNEAETVIQYKFAYGVEKPVLKEKSDYEKEMDQLWDEFEFALRASEDGTSAPSTASSQEDSEQHVETDSHISCGLGKQHHLILDEEIGIRCILCSYVKLDIKYILPDFGTSCARGRLSRRMSAEDEEFPMFDSFSFHETDGNQGSYLHTTGTVLDKLNNFPWIREKLYPHQIEGFEFLWRNLAGGIELDVLNMNPSHDVGGCIISHDPGTGKTLLTVAFLRTFMDTFKNCRPVLIAPSNLLLTWEEEFKKWKVDISFINLSTVKCSGMEECAAQKLVQNERSILWNRLAKIVPWSQGNSILAVSYQLFERHTAEELGGDSEENVRLKAEIRKALLEKPNLLILDEGHTPRNKNSKIYKCLKKVKTERRIILSGTLFQNNFDELYTTLSLARPEFADTISSKTDKNRGTPSKPLEIREEARGNWVSLASSIGNTSDDQQLEKIKKMMEPFVHEHKGSILHKKLPGLRECVVVLHPSPLQRKLLKNVREGMKNAFDVDHATALVAVHPSLLTRCSVAKQSGQVNSCVTTLIDENQQIKEDVFRLNYHEGVKSKFLMQLIKLSEAMKEKVLVFSQYLDPPSLICDHLYSALGWRMGEEILRMDGTLDVNKRQLLINRFNDPSSPVKVLFASTKTSGEGICLTGASRIVLLDVVWNPAVYKQAISRAYRLGQKKVVYTYHLITSRTSEEDKYLVQTRKDHLSQLVFSTEQHGKSENPDNPSSKFSDDKILQAMMENKEFKEIFDKIIPKESNLLETLGTDMIRNGTVV